MRMAAYCRVSTEREEQLSSLENQREFFYDYAKKCGDTLVKIYADQGISGKSMKNREEFIDLLHDSESGDFDYVAVKDISRFARNTSDFLYGIRTLRANGVDVRFLSGNQTVIGESEFILTVFAALAQEESANLSKRVIFGKRQNAQKGRVPNMIYGYDKCDTYTLSVNEDEARTVKMIFELYAAGYGTRRIAERLNLLKITTKKNVEWLPRTVRRILQNPIYIGKLINNKSTTGDFLSGKRKNLPEDEWFVHDRQNCRIISDEMFYKVQEILQERQKKYNSGEHHSAMHIFSNLIYCAECGKKFTTRIYSGGRVCYRCSEHNRGKCNNASTIYESELLNEIEKYIESVWDKKYIAKRLRNQVKNGDNVELMKKQKNELLRRGNKFKEMYVSGAIKVEELNAELEKIKNGLTIIEKAIPGAEKGMYRDDLTLKYRYDNSDMRELVNRITVTCEGVAEVYMK